MPQIIFFQCQNPYYDQQFLAQSPLTLLTSNVHDDINIVRLLQTTPDPNYAKVFDSKLEALFYLRLISPYWPLKENNHNLATMVVYFLNYQKVLDLLAFEGNLSKIENLLTGLPLIGLTKKLATYIPPAPLTANPPTCQTVT